MGILKHIFKEVQRYLQRIRPRPVPERTFGVKPTEVVKPSDLTGPNADRQTERSNGVVASWDVRELPTDGNVRIVVVGTRGAQIGKNNEQLNLREYRIEKPKIDLEEVFGRPTVQEELLRFAENPDDAAARQRLEHALSAVPITPGGLNDSILNDSAVASSSYKDGSWAWIDKTVIIIDSQGVQIGDHSRQRNSFVYTISPEIDAFSLLAENPKIVRALVDLVNPELSKNTSALRDEISDALQESVQKASASHPDRGVKFELPLPGQILRVTNVDGVVIGPVNEQTERTTVKVDTLRPVMKQASMAAQKLRESAAVFEEKRPPLPGREYSGDQWPPPAEDRVIGEMTQHDDGFTSHDRNPDGPSRGIR